MWKCTTKFRVPPNTSKPLNTEVKLMDCHDGTSKIKIETHEPEKKEEEC